MTTILFGILEEGLVYAVMALGVYITYKILDFPDLGVDGTFPRGGRCHGGADDQGRRSLADPARLPDSGRSGGTFTGLVHVKLKVRNLLAGIITMTACSP